MLTTVTSSKAAGLKPYTIIRENNPIGQGTGEYFKRPIEEQGQASQWSELGNWWNTKSNREMDILGFEIVSEPKE